MACSPDGATGAGQRPAPVAPSGLRVAQRHQKGRTYMHSHHRRSVRHLLLAGSVMLAITPAVAADVTPDRLVNADREPQNWLMNHRTYDAQRYSPLDKINKANIKDLKLAYAVAIGGTAANEKLELTPPASD